MKSLEHMSVSPDSVSLANKSHSSTSTFYRTLFAALATAVFGYFGLASEAKAEQPSSQPQAPMSSNYCTPLPGHQIDTSVSTMPILRGESIRGAIQAASTEHYRDAASQKRFRDQATDYLDDNFDMDATRPAQCDVPLCIDMVGGCTPHRFTDDNNGSNSSSANPAQPSTPSGVYRGSAEYKSLKEEFLNQPVKSDAIIGKEPTTEKELDDLLIKYGARKSASGEWVNERGSKLYVMEGTYDVPGPDHKLVMVFSGEGYQDGGEYLLRAKIDEDGKVIDVDEVGVLNYQHPFHIGLGVPWISTYTMIQEELKTGMPLVKVEGTVESLIYAAIAGCAIPGGPLNPTSPPDRDKPSPPPQGDNGDPPDLK